MNCQRANRARHPKVDPHELCEGCKIQNGNERIVRDIREWTLTNCVRVAKSKMETSESYETSESGPSRTLVRVDNSKTQGFIPVGAKNKSRKDGSSLYNENPGLNIELALQSKSVKQSRFPDVLGGLLQDESGPLFTIGRTMIRFPP